MNKKFFTLLVAFLATISFGAFAQGAFNVVPAEGNFGATATEPVLLEVSANNYLALSDDGTRLIIVGDLATKAVADELTFPELQRALWLVTTNTHSGGETRLVYTNLYSDKVLKLDEDAAVSIITEVPANANLIEGEIDVWSIRTKSADKTKQNFAYIHQTGGEEPNNTVVAMTAAVLDGTVAVVPAIYADYDALTEAADAANAAFANGRYGATLVEKVETLSGIYENTQEILPILKELVVDVTTEELGLVKSPMTWVKEKAADLKAALLTADANNDMIPYFVFQRAETVKNYIEENEMILVNQDIEDAYAPIKADMATVYANLKAWTDAYKTPTQIGEEAIDELVETIDECITSLLALLEEIEEDYVISDEYFKLPISLTAKVLTTPYQLTANDLNTVLGKQGEQPFPLTARATDFFSLNIDPAVAGHTVNLWATGNLQAHGVKYDGSKWARTTANFADATEPNIVLSIGNGTPKTAKYLVVDTAYIPGTQEINPSLIEMGTDSIFKKTRLQESYIFQFHYDAIQNTIVVKNLGYIQTPKELPNDKVSWALADATTQTIARNHTLTYAEFNNTIVHTFGAEPLEKELEITIGKDRRYNLVQLPEGVYQLKVVGTPNTDRSRVGKYIKANLIGQPEFMTEGEWQNFKNMPSSHWVINSTPGYYATITNREFRLGLGYDRPQSNQTYTAGTDKFFFLGGDTIQYIKLEDKYIDNPMLGYYEFEEGSELELSLDSYTFRYLHALNMDKPLAVANTTLASLFVNKDDEPAYFTLEKVGAVTYGTTGNIEGVARLVRNVYYLKTTRTTATGPVTGYVAYSAKDDKKYIATATKANAQPFLLKENNEVTADGKATPYYVLVEAIFTAGTFAKIDGEEVIEILPNGYVPNNEVYLDEPNGIKVYKVTLDDEGEVVNVVAAVTSNNYAAYKAAVSNDGLALTNGLLNDNSMAEVSNSAFKVQRERAKLYRTLEVAEVDDFKNEEANVEIFRLYAAAPEFLYEDANSNYAVKPLGPNKVTGRTDIKDQINFLGVDDKGSVAKNNTMIARYVRGTIMPQYLLMLGYDEVDGTEDEVCPICDPENPKENCPHHTPGEPGYIKARVLVSFADSVDKSFNGMATAYKWEGKTRLGFVDVIFTDEDSTMTILSDKENPKTVKFEDAAEIEGPHENYFFSFRLLDPKNDPDEDFLIESAGAVGGTTGMTWMKTLNGVPVLDKTTFAAVTGSQAERWNLNYTEKDAVSNEGPAVGTVEVTASYGTITVTGAAGQTVVITDILGKTIANTTVTSDAATFAAPAGVAVVKVAGEASKVLVK